MNEVSIHLLCNNQAGTLSTIIRRFGQFGLKYQKHHIKPQAENCLIIIESIGKLNCTVENLYSEFDKLPAVIEVQNIFLQGENVNPKGKSSPMPQSMKKSSAGKISLQSAAIINIVEPNSSDLTKAFNSVTVAHISPQTRITAEIIAQAEERLSETLGPYASLVVEPIAKKCHTAGELYTQLSLELDAKEERQEFLSVIKFS